MIAASNEVYTTRQESNVEATTPNETLRVNAIINSSYKIVYIY